MVRACFILRRPWRSRPTEPASPWPIAATTASRCSIRPTVRSPLRSARSAPATGSLGTRSTSTGRRRATALLWSTKVIRESSSFIPTARSPASLVRRDPATMNTVIRRPSTGRRRAAMLPWPTPSATASRSLTCTAASTTSSEVTPAASPRCQAPRPSHISRRAKRSSCRSWAPAASKYSKWTATARSITSSIGVSAAAA